MNNYIIKFVEIFSVFTGCSCFNLHWTILVHWMPFKAYTNFHNQNCIVRINSSVSETLERKHFGYFLMQCNHKLQFLKLWLVPDKWNLWKRNILHGCFCDIEDIQNRKELALNRVILSSCYLITYWQSDQTANWLLRSTHTVTPFVHTWIWVESSVIATTF